MQPLDISRLRSISDPAVSPDGSAIAFVVTETSVDDDEYRSSIWLWRDGEVAPFTSGTKDRHPRWSPDGRSLAFLRPGDDEKRGAQLAVMPTDGGEARILTDVELGLGGFEWSPDGTRFAMVTIGWAETADGLDTEERARRPRRITSPMWRFDNQGYRYDKVKAVAVMVSDGGEPTTLTPTDWRPQSITWHPDGSAVGVITEVGDSLAMRGVVEVHELPIDGGASIPLVGEASWSQLLYRPDGIAHLIGTADISNLPCAPVLYRLDSGTPTALGTGLDRDITATPGGIWSDDGALTVIAQDRGRQIVVELDADGGHRELFRKDAFVTALAAGGGRLVGVLEHADRGGELVEFTDGVATELSTINTEADVPLVAPRHLVIERDGVELDVWIYLPPGDGTVPVLFNIHGGPAAQYGWFPFDEFQVWVGAGYGVVATNPRGASGAGDAFMKGCVGVWGEEQPPDALDLLAALDAAVAAEPRLDGDRVGIMGGSYGGLITTKILSFDHRWACAVPERGVYNWVSMMASDIGQFFTEVYLRTDDPIERWRMSSLSVADRITTPCLVIHSDADHRCPPDQGQQLFGTLLANGVPVEYLEFPGEGHELSRSGTPKHRVERFEAILEYVGRYLPVD